MCVCVCARVYVCVSVSVCVTVLVCLSVRRPQISILIGNPDGPNTITVTLPPGPGLHSLQWRNTHYGPGQSFNIILNKDEFADIKQQDGSV